ncbi:long-chain acyl-CoA synthetase [Saccharomonospora amisosensis]|uniref:Long-chain acyl-CoA synthetase n=1 Tax=Saccharomonospora amisosensis TaxID=1128677 RepID=A0A7X5UV67_9PSEU|nr:AMP-binding protein [Saccharomonospora amisosensis]NIJ14745.1 long-chain acyl-CoA synthetase [Saccharomonospora amisosensis]
MTGVRGNVADLVSTAATAHPTTVALIDTVSGDTVTWKALDAAVDALARSLSEAGLRPGDRVALRSPTCPAFAIGFFAVARAGGIVVPLSPQAPNAELLPVLEQSGARMLLGSADAELGHDLTVLEPDLGASGDPVDPVGGGEDIAALLYTSGTAGPARGVMLSHRALLANVEQLRSLTPPVAEPGDRVFIAIPLHHIYGLGPGLLTAAAAGATAVLAPRFEARQALAHCSTHRVTVLLGVPGMYADFAALPPEEVGERLSTVRLLVSGAAPLRPKVLAAMRAATGLAVYEGYGLTEAAPVVTSTLVTGYAKPGSVGRPLPGVEVRLVDSDGSGEGVPLDPADPDDAFGEDEAGTGLVAIRGENLFSGYWPDGAHGPDADGWVRTGDVGYLDTDGDLHLVDRANDLIIVNGFNVYPREVEQVIAELPQVAEVAVVGMLDERSGEAVRAVVVPKPGAALSEQQVLQRCSERLAGYKVPATVRFVSELPHSPTGKLRRLDLRS